MEQPIPDFTNPTTLQFYISSIISFLSEHKTLIHCHITEAYIANSFTLFPPSWFDALLNLQYTDYLNLSSIILKLSQCPEADSLVNFLSKAKSLSPKFPKYSSEIPISLKESMGMSPKKIHETSRLTSFITKKFQKQNIKKIIDLGAGQGYLSLLLASKSSFSVTAIEGRKHNSEKSEKRAKKISQPTIFQNLLQNVCEIVQGDELDQYTDENCGIVGLHTCGDLASDSLKMFVNSKNVKGIVNVGCCYHLLTEFVNRDSLAYLEYVESVGQSADGRSLDETLVDDPEKAGFPLSGFIKTEFPGFMLGKLVRALCIGDSSEQGVKKAIFNFRKMEYRAAFQYLLCNRYPEYSKVFAIGNKIRKFEDFAGYCETAFQRLKLENSLSKSELNEFYLNNFEKHEKKISVLWTLRSVFSGPIENLILLDRLLYLHEQGFHAKAYSVFNRDQSPRNTAICAFKLS